MDNSIVSTRISDDVYQKLKFICKKKNQSCYQILANLIERYIDDPNCFDHQTIPNIQFDASLMEQQETIIDMLTTIQAMLENIRNLTNFIIAGIKIIGNGNKSVDHLFSRLGFKQMDNKS